MVLRGRALLIAVTLLVLTLLPTTAVAHTSDELDAWRLQWATKAINHMTRQLTAEYRDMAARHPRYFGLPHVHQTARNTVRPVGTPLPTQQGPPTDAGDWRPLVSRYFAAADVDKALRVIYCESRNLPTAKNPNSSASGLWQHLGRYWSSRSAAAGIPGASIWDPEASTIVAAYLVYQDTGWGHWPRCGR